MQYRIQIHTHHDEIHHGAPMEITPEQAEQAVENIQQFLEGHAIHLEQTAGAWLVIPTREIRHIRVVPVEVTES